MLCHYAEYRILFIIMLNVIMLSVITHNFVAPNKGLHLSLLKFFKCLPQWNTLAYLSSASVTAKKCLVTLTPGKGSAYLGKNKQEYNNVLTMDALISGCIGYRLDNDRF